MLFASSSCLNWFAFLVPMASSLMALLITCFFSDWNGMFYGVSSTLLPLIFELSNVSLSLGCGLKSLSGFLWWMERAVSTWCSWTLSPLLRMSSTNCCVFLWPKSCCIHKITKETTYIEQNVLKLLLGDPGSVVLMIGAFQAFSFKDRRFLKRGG